MQGRPDDEDDYRTSRAPASDSEQPATPEPDAVDLTMESAAEVPWLVPDRQVGAAEAPASDRARSSESLRREAFAGLVDRHLDDAYRLAGVILGDPTESEDAVHDAAVIAWRRFADLRESARFEAWFGRILVNVCRDRLRSRHRHPIVDLGPMLEATVEGRPGRGDPAPTAGERDAVAIALERLSPDHRIVLVLRFWLDLTVDQIAERMGIPAGTVKSRLHAALGRLRSELGADDWKER